VGLIDFPGTSGLAIDRPAVNDNNRREPAPSLALPPPRFFDVLRLDPKRVGLDLRPAPPERYFPYGPIGSLLLHLLPLLLLLDWARTTPEISTPIPIQLVLEQPPPPPPPAPQPAQKKAPVKQPLGRLASDDMAETEGPKVEPPKLDFGKNDPQPQAADRESSAPETRTASAAASTAPPTPDSEKPTVPQPSTAATQSTLVAPPLPIPLNEQAGDELPSPTAETQIAALTPPSPPPPPKPAPLRERAAVHVPSPLGSAWPLPLHQAAPTETPHTARFVGPPAIRDEYCAAALALTLRHIGLLPLSLVGARQGETHLSIRVLGDGTINSVKVEQSSGYPEIDQRIEQMVLAVGRFPPLPRWMGPWMDFTFHLHFPHPLQR
jgi:protein TonB